MPSPKEARELYTEQNHVFMRMRGVQRFQVLVDGRTAGYDWLLFFTFSESLVVRGRTSGDLQATTVEKQGKNDNENELENAWLK